MGEYHDKGEQDKSSGRDYNPPGSNMPIIDDILPRSEKEIADRKDYDAGWRNARDQKK